MIPFEYKSPSAIAWKAWQEALKVAKQADPKYRLVASAAAQYWYMCHLCFMAQDVMSYNEKEKHNG